MFDPLGRIPKHDANVDRLSHRDLALVNSDALYGGRVGYRGFGGIVNAYIFEECVVVWISSLELLVNDSIELAVDTSLGGGV